MISTKCGTAAYRSTLPRPYRIFLLSRPPRDATPGERSEDGLGIQASTTKICNVCSSTDVATGSKQCPCHRKAVTAIIGSFSKIGLSHEEQKARTDFKNMISQAPDEPPSQFAATVLDFELTFPGRGQGTRRGHYIRATMDIIKKYQLMTPAP